MLMAEFTSHTPGSFSWVELATTDPKAGVAFYRDLFGWDVVEHDMGPNGIYTILTLRGKDVAAGAGQHPEERKMGVPPHWNLYVTVASADQAAEKARSLGATLLDAPFDVMHQGRMAIISDPTGAVLQLWEPKAHIGVKIRNEPNSLTWSELTTRDPKAAEAFYTQMFGWTAKHSAPTASMDYTEFSVNGQPGVGMMAMPENMPPQVPSYWMPYFQVSDLDASIAKARNLGANVMVGPNSIPDGGRFVILQDPQKAMFALYQSA
jgi:predicted enzyme related to lactoylglutathione lyase